MKKSRLMVFFVVSVLLTSSLFIVVGNMSGDAPETVSAGRLTEDMIGLCMIMHTIVGTEYVDFLAFMNCCLVISQN